MFEESFKKGLIFNTTEWDEQAISVLQTAVVTALHLVPPLACDFHYEPKSIQFAANWRTMHRSIRSSEEYHGLISLRNARATELSDAYYAFIEQLGEWEFPLPDEVARTYGEYIQTMADIA